MACVCSILVPLDGYWTKPVVGVRGRDNVQMRGVEFHMEVE